MAWSSWPTLSRFLETMPAQLLFFVGTFFLFLPTGLLADVAAMGATPLPRLVAASILGGLSTIAHVLVVRFGPRFIFIVIALHVAISAAIARTFGPPGAALEGEALRARLEADVHVVTASLILSFIRDRGPRPRRGARPRPAARRSVAAAGPCAVRARAAA